MARMKVKAGARSVMTDANIGELYPIPTHIRSCKQHLSFPTKSIKKQFSNRINIPNLVDN